MAEGDDDALASVKVGGPEPWAEGSALDTHAVCPPSTERPGGFLASLFRGTDAVCPPPTERPEGFLASLLRGTGPFCPCTQPRHAETRRCFHKQRSLRGRSREQRAAGHSVALARDAGCGCDPAREDRRAACAKCYVCNACEKFCLPPRPPAPPPPSGLGGLAEVAAVAPQAAVSNRVGNARAAALAGTVDATEKRWLEAAAGALQLAASEGYESALPEHKTAAYHRVRRAARGRGAPRHAATRRMSCRTVRAPHLAHPTSPPRRPSTLLPLFPTTPPSSLL